MQSDSGILLEREGEQADLVSLEEINAVLAPVGARIWAQDLSGLLADLKEFLADHAPSPERVAEVMPRFLLSRERLLELIAEAGREPHVPGGGELTTLDETHGVTYPQLYVARPGTDFSRFDRMHVNIGTDDTPVDDVVQLLCGSGLVVHLRLPAGETVKVSLSCPTPDSFRSTAPSHSSAASAEPLPAPKRSRKSSARRAGRWCTWNSMREEAKRTGRSIGEGVHLATIDSRPRIIPLRKLQRHTSGNKVDATHAHHRYLLRWSRCTPGARRRVPRPEGW